MTVQPESVGDISPEELAALEMLSKSRRLMVVFVPEHVSDEFCKRLSVWTSYALDTGILPRLHVPAVKVGDGIHCPYCGTAIKPNPLKGLTDHAEDCAWRKATTRWGYANMQIDKEEGV